MAEVILVNLPLDEWQQGNKALPEPMVTQISVAIWRHQAPMN